MLACVADLSQIQFGDVATWVSGVGALFAGGTALWIAGHDRRERERERQDDARAQARLIVASVLPVATNLPVKAMREALAIANFSQAPVYSVRLLSVVCSDPECEVSWTAEVDRSGDVLRQLVQPGENVVIPAHVSILGPYVQLSKATVAVRYAFTDVNGLRWERTGDGPPARTQN